MATAAPLALDELDWRVVNDDVMGGVSSGRVAVGDTVRFTGELSLENNGGFVSIRTTPADLPLDDALALRVTLAGDDRTWDLTLRRADVPIRAGSYRVPVQAPSEPVTLEVPLSAFRPTSFGRPVPGAPALDARRDRIDSIGFLLADRNPGPFRLEVLALEVVGGAAPRGDGLARVQERLADAVSAGAPAFDGGDPGRCRDLYAAALSEVADHPALTAGERAIVREALARATGQAATDAAWTLRHGIDTVMRAETRR